MEWLASKLGSAERLVPQGEQEGAEFVNESEGQGSSEESRLGRNKDWKRWKVVNSRKTK